MSGGNFPMIASNTQILFTPGVAISTKLPIGFLFYVMITASKVFYSVSLGLLPCFTCLYFLLRNMNLLLLDSSIYLTCISNRTKLLKTRSMRCTSENLAPNSILATVWIHINIFE